MVIGSCDWTLRNPTIYCQQAGEPGKWWYKSVETEGLRTRRANVVGLEKGRGWVGGALM